MAGTKEIITLFVCEDGKWGLAERYKPAQDQKAISDARLSLRAGGVSSVRVIHQRPDAKTGRAHRSLLFEADKPGTFSPAPPALAMASEGEAPLPAPAQRGLPRPGAPIAAAPARFMHSASAARTGGSFEAQNFAPSSQLGLSGRPGEPARPTLFARLAAWLAPPAPAFESRETAVAVEAKTPASGTAARNAGMGAVATAHREARRLLEFLQACLTEASAGNHLPSGGIDANLRFGLHLFMLGAGQACLVTAAGRLTLADLLETPLSLLGSEPAKARRFAEGIDAYRDDSRHAAMIEAGGEAMAGFLASARVPPPLLARALQLWQSPAPRPHAAEAATGQDVAIMFTDMVSSVETTQQLGEDGMMQLVESHNLIVGAVLKECGGHQVKHTGDGIMAVFPRVADGIAAAGEIQRQIAEHNEATVGAPLRIRIGLSAGSPIRKDDDYFGTVVQTAARICPLAAAGEVALPDAMTRLPHCEGFAYSEPFTAPLKGFAEPQLVRKLLWEAMR